MPRAKGLVEAARTSLRDALGAQERQSTIGQAAASVMKSAASIGERLTSIGERLTSISQGLVRSSNADRRMHALRRQKTDTLDPWRGQAVGSSLNLKRARSKKRKPRTELTGSTDRAQRAAALVAQAAIEEEAPEAPLAWRLIALLREKNLKHDDLMAQWDRNHDNVISKSEFRVHVRKLGFELEGGASLDALFDALDASRTGELTRDDLRRGLRRLADEANEGQRQRQRVAAHAARLREAAAAWSVAAEEAAAFERALGMLEVLRKGGGSVESRLGALLCARNTKVGRQGGRRTRPSALPPEYCGACCRVPPRCLGVVRRVPARCRRVASEYSRRPRAATCLAGYRAARCISRCIGVAHPLPALHLSGPSPARPAPEWPFPSPPCT